MLLGAMLACGMLAAPAAARIFELGQTATPVGAPPPCNTVHGRTTCPGGVSANNYAIILPHVTGVETLRDGRVYPTTAPRAGRLVAFTVGLSALDRNHSMRRSEIRSQDQAWAGTTRVQITVLRRVGARRRHIFKTVGQGPVVHVQPYLGLVVQFPLDRALVVHRGDVIGLTTPTWAPMLTIMLNSHKFAYRQSRSKNCGNPAASSQAQNVGQQVTYGCDYPGTRMEYSATEVSTPSYPKHYVRARDTAAARAMPQVLTLGSARPTGGAGL